MSSDNNDYKIMKPEEFLQHSKKKENTICLVYRGQCVDLTNFKHPGGKFLHEFNGKDATEYIDVAHYSDKRMKRIINNLTIGKLEDPNILLTDEDKELRLLELKYHKLGYYKFKGYSKVLTLSFLYIICGILSLLKYQFLSSFLLFITTIRLYVFCHDTLHHANFENFKTGSFIVNLLLFIIVGFFGAPPFHHHAIHHGFTNVLDYDMDYLGPFQLDIRHKSKSPQWFVKIQGILWFGLVVPLSWWTLWFNVNEPRAKHTWWKGVLLIIRLLIIYKFSLYYLLIIPSISLAVYLYLAALNHYHMDKVESVSERTPYKECISKYGNPSFVAAMVLPSTSYHSSKFISWITGGFDYHIEHHLFPNMPSEYLPLIRNDVLKLLKKYNIEYNTTTFLHVVWLNFIHVMKPYGPTVPGIVPGKVAFYKEDDDNDKKMI